MSIFEPTKLFFLCRGLGITCVITALVAAISMAVGFVLALANRYGMKPLRRATGAYIAFFRNTPMLLWIMVVRFLVPLPLPAAGVLAMSLVAASNIAEDIRGGFQMIPAGQYEAASAQGFHRMQMLRLIILPQLFRRILPILLSECVIVLKNTSLLWAIGIEELTGRSMILMNKISNVTEMFILYLMIAGMYFAVNELLTGTIRRLSAKTASWEGH